MDNYDFKLSKSCSSSRSATARTDLDVLDWRRQEKDTQFQGPSRVHHGARVLHSRKARHHYGFMESIVCPQINVVKTMTACTRYRVVVFSLPPCVTVIVMG